MQVKFLSPLVVQVLDGPVRDFVLFDDFLVNINGRDKVIPKGFITDFASVPSVFQNVVQNDDPYVTKAAVVHDYLYANHGYCWLTAKPFIRSECDLILLDGMITLGCPWWKRNVIWLGVRMGGSIYFEVKAKLQRMPNRVLRMRTPIGNIREVE